MVLPSADSSVSFLTRILETCVLLGMGLASYSMLLWHEPLIRLVQKSALTFAGRVGFVMDLLMLAALTAMLAGLAYRLVERSALARKRR